MLPSDVGVRYHSESIPPDIQFRKRIFQPQISVPIDKPYKWNIAGLLEQKIINHMSKVNIAHQNNYDIDQPDTFDYSVVVSPSYRRWRHPSRKVNS